MRTAPQIKLARSKKAQDATAAATLVAIIALLIIFYLLFIPPAVRDQILEGDGTEATGTGINRMANQTILLENPGTLTPIKTDDVEHSIPAVYLYAKEASKVIGTKSAISAKASVFSEKPSSMTFDIKDAENTDNIMLSFVSDARKGDLIVKLNNEEVYSAPVKTANPTPIIITKSMLVSGQNRLDFMAEDPGWKFWRVNKHELTNLQVTADVTDVSQQKSKNIFIVSATEKVNAGRDVLRFSPVCKTGQAGKLNVLINGHSVYYTVPDCGGRIAIEFDPNILRQGENNIVFMSEQGNYLIDLIKITSELKKVVHPVSYFQVSESDISQLNAGSTKMYLKMTFVDGTDYKSGTININGRETNLHQKEIEYEKDISNYVVKGNNAVKITPKTTINVMKLEVFKK